MTESGHAPPADNAGQLPPQPPTADLHVSIVVPCFDEAPVLPTFDARLRHVMNALPCTWTVIYVNDASRDETLAVMLALQHTHPNVAIINLSRNFGKEAAMTAGLDHTNSDAVVVIDADLQDPPEIIPDLFAAWQAGADVAYAQRRVREGETLLKRFTARMFYRLMARVGRVNLPVDTGDFRLMSRRAVDALLRLREHHRFMKGLFAWVGFAQVPVLYDRAPRFAGRTKWNYWNLWNFALEGITSFTTVPLRLATYAGLLLATCAAIYGVVIILDTLGGAPSAPGYPSLMAVILFLGGMQLMTLGLIGEYLGRVFNEVKARPLYLVERYSPSRNGTAPHGPEGSSPPRRPG